MCGLMVIQKKKFYFETYRQVGNYALPEPRELAQALLPTKPDQRILSLDRCWEHWGVQI